MGRRIPILKTCGQGPNEEFVFRGMFNFENTHGIHLADILQEFKEKNILVCWTSYILESISFGKRKESIINYILNSVVEANFIPETDIEIFKDKLINSYNAIIKQKS